MRWAIGRLSAIVFAAGLIGGATSLMSAPNAYGEHTMRLADDLSARITFALFSALPGEAGALAGPVWIIEGAEVSQPLVVDRLSSLPKAAQCTALGESGGFRIVCESIGKKVDENSSVSMERVGSQPPLLGRLFHRLGDQDLIAVAGPSLTLQLPASALRQWAEDYRLQPSPDVALRDPTPDELRSGIRAAIYLELHPGQFLSGIELVRETKRER